LQFCLKFYTTEGLEGLADKSVAQNGQLYDGYGYKICTPHVLAWLRDAGFKSFCDDVRQAVGELSLGGRVLPTTTSFPSRSVADDAVATEDQEPSVTPDEEEQIQRLERRAAEKKVAPPTTIAAAAAPTTTAAGIKPTRRRADQPASVLGTPDRKKPKSVQQRQQQQQQQQSPKHFYQAGRRVLAPLPPREISVGGGGDDDQSDRETATASAPEGAIAN
jgi:hypothetical protein